jgi:hypothetical protein
MQVIKRVTLVAVASVALSLTLAAGAMAAPARAASFIGGFRTLTTVASTVPKNIGDVNPYGVAVVRQSQGKLVKGNVLVSNFNNAANQQGTGTTIMSISPRGSVSLFAHISATGPAAGCIGGIGLTTALSILDGGWVVVGSLPTTGGDPATSKAGCLLVLNSQGRVVETFAGHGINGPWDMTAVSFGRVAVLFVTNVLNGTVAAAGGKVNRGTVLRLVVTTPRNGLARPRLLDSDVIGSGFAEKTDPNALVIGPTGVGLGRDGTLYVADTLGNRITAIRDALFRRGSAGTGRVVTAGRGLNGPLGLAIAPGGGIVTANSGDGNLVETTPRGVQSPAKQVTPGGAGALFGLAIAPRGSGVYFVDDSVNTLNLLGG